MKTLNKKDLSIIAIHGNGGGGFRFALAKPYFPESVSFFNPTLPGFDSAIEGDVRYSMKGYARWLADYMEQIDGPRILLGHGLGGAFVLEFLQHYSSLVDGVILHSIVGANLDKRNFPKIMRLPGVASLTKASISNPLMRPVFSRMFFQSDIDQSYEKRFFKAFGRCRVFERMFSMIDHEWFQNLSPVFIPAVFLWGEQDWILKTHEVEAFRKLFPTHEIQIISEWDHFPMIDQPASFAEEVTKLAYRLIKESEHHVLSKT